jgi:hypothetical protein
VKNNEPLEQLSFSLDLLNLDCKLTCQNPSVDDEAGTSVYLIEEALRAKGLRAQLGEKAK